MTKRRFVWNLLSILCVAALLVSGAWVKATDAASLTHHELTLKDEKGKPLGQAHCVIVLLRCVSKELKVHEGEVKAGRKIVTMKQPLFSCFSCNMLSSVAHDMGCCYSYQQCRFANGECIDK